MSIAVSQTDPPNSQLRFTFHATPKQLLKTRWKELQGLGHKLERFLAARAQCWRYLRNKEPDASRAWDRLLGEKAPAGLDGEGIFGISVSQHPTGWLLLHGILAEPQAETLASLALPEPNGSSRTDRAVLPIPADANDPLWYALLRLRPLRDLWDRELRRSAADDLRRILPDAWIYDKTDLPPGAIIPRLELTSWDQANADFLKERGLAWVEAPSLLTGSEVTAPAVVLETHDRMASPAPSAWVGIYERKENRVDGLGAVALEYMPEGEVIAHPVTIA